MGKTALQLSIVLLFLAFVTGCPHSGSRVGQDRTEQARQHLQRGLELVKDGQRDQALTELDKAIALDPNWILLHYNRSIIYSQLGQIANEEAGYRRVIELAPLASKKERGRVLAASYYNLVFITLARGQVDQAFIYLDKALIEATHVEDYYHDIVGNKDLAVLRADDRFEPLMRRYWPDYGQIVGKLPSNSHKTESAIGEPPRR